MFTSFLESVGQGLSEKWQERLFGPAFLFWGGGLLLWLTPERLPAMWDELSALPLVTQTVLLIGALLVLGASDRLMETLSPHLLRWLEGYWPGPLSYPAGWLAAWRRKRFDDQRRRLSALLLKKQENTLTWAEARQLARLEAWRLYTPRDADDILPTRLGDILRAAETRPRQRFGLDPVLLWPRLWLLLPENVRSDLSAARARLDSLVQTFGWGALFLLWSFAWPWACVIALLWMWIAYRLILQAALPFADLVQSAFEVHRWRLYEAFRWPLPAESGAAEIAAGEALSRFVQRGMSEAPVKYTGG